MSLITTLFNFLSLKTRSDTFPKTKVSGTINRSLAILSGLSQGGIRTCQVDSAGQLLTRPLDLADCEMIENGYFEDKNWHISGNGAFDLSIISTVVSTTHPAVVEIKTGESGDVIAVPLPINNTIYITPYRWSACSGQLWIKGDRLKIQTEALQLVTYYSIFKLPER